MKTIVLLIVASLTATSVVAQTMKPIPGMAAKAVKAGNGTRLAITA